MSRWIQKAIKRPGRVKRYLMRKYGRKALTKNGEVKQQYVNKAIRELRARRKKRGRFTKNELSLYRALILARRLERLRKD